MNHADEARRYRMLAAQELELGRLRASLPNRGDDVETAPLSPFAVAAHYGRRARVHDTLARARVQGTEQEGNAVAWLDEASRLALGGSPFVYSEGECIAYAEALASELTSARSPYAAA